MLKLLQCLQLDSYKACLRCKARVEPSGEDAGRCSKRMIQRLDFCTSHQCAKLMVMANTKTFVYLSLIMKYTWYDHVINPIILVAPNANCQSCTFGMYIMLITFLKCVYERVMVNVKIMSNTGKKAECTCKVTLWEEQIGSFEVYFFLT